MYFTPYILRVFEFYSIKFELIWILQSEILEFEDVKLKHFQILGSKTQIQKFQCVKFKYFQTLKV